jgi:hypothetical protein
MVLSCVVPSFGTYMYDYIIDVVKLSQFEFAMLSLVGNLTLVPGSLLYQKYLLEKEYRMMMIVAVAINVFGNGMTTLFTHGIYFHKPFWFALGTSTVTDVLYYCFSNLPLQVLFAKLVPERIESSLYAFSTGLMNLASLFIAPNLGNLINVLFF